MTSLLSLLAIAAAQDCPDAAAAVRDATEQLLLLDDTQTQAALDRVRASLSCRPIDADSLVRFWLLDGALKHTGGDEAGARVSFATAAGVDPAVWMSDLGPALEAVYREVATPTGEGTLDVRGVDGYTLRVDGRVRTVPTTLGAGQHLLQVLDGEAVIHHRDVVVIAGQGSVVDPQLPAKVAPAKVRAPKPTNTADGPSTAVRLHGAAGFGMAWGDEIANAGLVETASKPHVPVELGLSLERGPWWVRGQLGLAPLLSDHLLYLANDDVAAIRSFREAGLTAGAKVAGFRAGALVQAMMPSRTGLRLAVSQSIAGPFAVEARAGINLHSARSPEPAVSGLLVWRPTL